MTYFGVTISVGCLATSLPTVLSSLEIKWFWEVTCQHYLCSRGWWQPCISSVRQNRPGYHGLPGTGAELHFWHFLTPLKRAASLLFLGPASFIHTSKRSQGSEHKLCLSRLSIQGSQVSSSCMAWLVTPPSVRLHQAAQVRGEQGWRVREVENCPTSPYIVLLSMDSRHPHPFSGLISYPVLPRFGSPLQSVKTLHLLQRTLIPCL